MCKPPAEELPRLSTAQSQWDEQLLFTKLLFETQTQDLLCLKTGTPRPIIMKTPVAFLIQDPSGLTKQKPPKVPTQKTPLCLPSEQSPRLVQQRAAPRYLWYTHGSVQP